MTDDLTWIENPESVGLRFVALAHDIKESPIKHKGWFLDDYQHETVCGVIYRLPAKNGRARYVAGYADPWNCNQYGEGPARLNLGEIIEGEQYLGYYDRNLDDGMREAARLADGYAERMAESEREYNSAYEAGRNAREQAQAARQFAADYVASVRALRDVFAMRHGLKSPRQTIRMLISDVRRACLELESARETARDARDDKPEKYQPPLRMAWLEGYENHY